MHRLQRCTAFFVKKKTSGKIMMLSSPKTTKTMIQTMPKVLLISCSTYVTTSTLQNLHTFFIGSISNWSSVEVARARESEAPRVRLSLVRTPGRVTATSLDSSVPIYENSKVLSSGTTSIKSSFFLVLPAACKPLPLLI